MLPVLSGLFSTQAMYYDNLLIVDRHIETTIRVTCYSCAVTRHGRTNFDDTTGN